MTFGTIWQKLVRKTDPVTSIEAAITVNTRSMEQIVYDTICQFPDGCIQDEVLQVLNFYPYSSVTARFKALIEKGYIEDTGKTRPGRSGKQQRVIKIVEKNHA
jgi:hypothetical protein